MVDFNNEATIGTPALDIVRVLVLERLNNLYDAIEDYYKKEELGSNIGIAYIKSRLYNLFIILQPQFKRRLKDDDYNRLLKNLESTDVDTIFNVIYQINEYLDELRLTRLDLRKVYDYKDVEADNREHGYY